MVDIITLIIASTALITAFFSHIRHSECYGLKIDTRSGKNTPPTTPSLNDNLKTPLMTKPSGPINIPAKIEPKKIYM
jgi:hypothetical protein